MLIYTLLMMECWWWWSWCVCVFLSCVGRRRKTQNCQHIQYLPLCISLQQQKNYTLCHLFCPQWEISSSRPNVCYAFMLYVVLRKFARENKWSLISFLLSHWCFLFTCLLKEPGPEQAKWHWLHLFDFSPLCVFKCLLKSNARTEANSHWLHLFDFSPLCVFKCLLKWSAWEDA